MNIYLDIDGVLLTKEGLPAPFLYEFLEYVTKEHQCFWLTTHCRFGNADDPCRHIKQRIKDGAGWIYRIKPTKWNVLKTDGIDFTQEFIWLDDYLMDAEKNVIAEKDVLNSFISIDLKKNPNHLKEIASMLKERFRTPVWE